MKKTLNRPAMGMLAVAAGAALFLTGCSDDDKDSADATNTSATSAVTSETTSAAETSPSAVEGLDNAQAQTILDTALNPETSDEEVAKVADVSAPGAKEALKAYAEVMSKTSYQHTVKSVAADGEDKAKVTVNVADEEHPERAMDMELVFVKVDGDWKLSADAVTQLSSMASARGGR